MTGTKRASPGADTEKNPLSNVELSDEDAAKLANLQNELARAELVLGKSQLAGAKFSALFNAYFRASSPT